ncbi:hypothetical protein BKA70DRAFT_1578835 [Coprinopsis sp. MPI-PUGE-AT-0042]|nr:hypothetical protein BKA70DRAFT_1578835 [Coprinopsis sp. MPI-PUGE-AT-0042]
MEEERERALGSIIEFLQNSITDGTVKQGRQKYLEIAIQYIGEAFGVDKDQLLKDKEKAITALARVCFVCGDPVSEAEESLSDSVENNAGAAVQGGSPRTPPNSSALRHTILCSQPPPSMSTSTAAKVKTSRVEGVKGRLRKASPNAYARVLTQPLIQGALRELTRQKVEDTKQEEEKTRQEKEKTRQEEAKARQKVEETKQEEAKARQKVEDTRQKVEDTRQKVEDAKIAMEVTKQEEAKARQLEATLKLKALKVEQQEQFDHQEQFHEEQQLDEQANGRYSDGDQEMGEEETLQRGWYTHKGRKFYVDEAGARHEIEDFKVWNKSSRQPDWYHQAKQEWEYMKQ